jgi:hypothetical protein
MTRDQAAAILRLLVEGQRALAAAEEFASTSVADRTERDSLRKTLAKAIGTVAGDAIAPIVQLYPDLDPYAGVDSDKIWPRR